MKENGRGGVVERQQMSCSSCLRCASPSTLLLAHPLRGAKTHIRCLHQVWFCSPGMRHQTQAGGETCSFSPRNMFTEIWKSTKAVTTLTLWASLITSYRYARGKQPCLEAGSVCPSPLHTECWSNHDVEKCQKHLFPEPPKNQGRRAYVRKRRTQQKVGCLTCLHEDAGANSSVHPASVLREGFPWPQIPAISVSRGCSSEGWRHFSDCPFLKPDQETGTEENRYSVPFIFLFKELDACGLFIADKRVKMLA